MYLKIFIIISWVVIASLTILIVNDNLYEAEYSDYFEVCLESGGAKNQFNVWPASCIEEGNCDFGQLTPFPVCEFSDDEAFISSKEQCAELEGDVNQKKIFPYCDFGNNGCDPKLYSYCSFWPEEFDQECKRVGGEPKTKLWEEPCEGEICLDRAIYYRHCYFPGGNPNEGELENYFSECSKRGGQIKEKKIVYTCPFGASCDWEPYPYCEFK